MFNVFIKHFIYEACITQIMDRIGNNLFNQIPPSDTPFNYDKELKKWQPVIDNTIFPPVPKHLLKMSVQCLSGQARFNHSGLSTYLDYQKYALPVLRKMFNDTDLPFNFSETYNPKYKGTIKVSESIIEDLACVSRGSTEVAVLEYFVYELNAQLVGAKLNGLLLHFHEDKTSMSIYY